MDIFQIDESLEISNLHRNDWYRISMVNFNQWRIIRKNGLEIEVQEYQLFAIIDDFFKRNLRIYHG